MKVYTNALAKSKIITQPRKGHRFRFIEKLKHFNAKINTDSYLPKSHH